MAIDLDEVPPPVGDWRDRGIYTDAGYPTEKDSVAALMDILAGLRSCFDVHAEVRGQYLSSRTDAQLARPRVDVFLVPRPMLTAQGWNLGAVAIECKRSGEKLGRPISQMIDYRAAAFRVRDIDIVPRRVLLWPLSPFGGPLASVMAQQGLGCAMHDGQGGIYMTAGQVNLAHVDQRGRLTIGRDAAVIGNKRGSR